MTAITGGVSRSTQSKCCRKNTVKSLKRFDPSSSAGLGGCVPAGISQSPGVEDSRIASEASELPTSRFERPGAASQENMSCTRGFRMSQSTRSTR